MSTGIIIQARLGSTRLPNKVLKALPYNSKLTVLDQILNRAALVSNVDKIIVATSDQSRDDQLEDYLKNREGIHVYRGSENNVLRRFYHSAKESKLDHIVRLTADNPCIDFKLIKATIENHIEAKADYSYTRGYPLGMNIEIISFKALEKAFELGSTAADKEHVTYYVRQHPADFKLNFIDAVNENQLGHLRLTMDTPKDYTAIKIVFDYISKDNFGIEDIVQLYKNHPHIFDINNEVLQKKVFTTANEELIAAEELLSKQDMHIASKIIREYRG